MFEYNATVSKHQERALDPITDVVSRHMDLWKSS